MYQSLLHLSWIDKLLENVKTLFVDLYGQQLGRPNTSVVECPFDEYFDQQIKELEGSSGQVGVGYGPRVTVIESPLPTNSEDNGQEQASDVAVDEPVSGPESTKKPAVPSSHLLSAPTNRPGPRSSRRARKAAHQSAHASSGDESGTNQSKNTKGGQKKMRRWDVNGLVDEDDDVRLDYSAPSSNDAHQNGDLDVSRHSESVAPVDHKVWGKKTGDGTFVLRDLDEEVHSILASADEKKAANGNGNVSSSSGVVASGLGTLSNLFRNVVGGKVLTKEDLDKAIKGMEEHLLKKNVAREAAVHLCQGVETSLIGVKTGSFQSQSCHVAFGNHR